MKKMWTEDHFKLLDHWCSPALVAAEEFSYVIAIPAMNEQETVVACLQACWQSMQRSAGNGKILLVINNTSDESELKAISWAEKTCCPLEIINMMVANDYAHAGLIRQMAMALASLSVRMDGVIMSTDADSRPDPDWVTSNLARITEGYHLVCGEILLDSSDPQYQAICTIHRKNALEGQYRQATMELIHQLDPDPDNPWPHHNQTSGASLAITRAVLDAVGGVPAVLSAEDRALARCVALHDYRICYCSRARVVTSCRMVGRATGGMADALQVRAGSRDYQIDESLEPAHLVLLRSGTRASAKTIWKSGVGRHELYSFLDIDPTYYVELDKAKKFGLFWQQLEEHADCLKGERIFYSEIPRQLKRIRTIINLVNQFKAT